MVRVSPLETRAYAREYLGLSPTDNLAAALLQSGLNSRCQPVYRPDARTIWGWAARPG